MAQKTYFIFPTIFEHMRDLQDIDVPFDDPNFPPVDKPRCRWKINTYQVGGVNQLINSPVSSGIIFYSDMEFSECNSDLTVCNIGGIQNSWNPFFKGIFADFPIVDGVARGVSTGTTNGINYGYGALNFTVDKERIYDGNGIPRFGSFAIDIDYDQDFILSIEISVPTTNNIFIFGESVVFTIKHTAATCTSEYYATILVDGNQIVNPWPAYGFLSGEEVENEAQQYHIVPSCYEIPPVDVCLGYKTKSKGKLVKIPVELTPVAIKEGCCFKLNVFAEQTTKTEDWKNDFKLLPVQKRQTDNDTFRFRLHTCGQVIELNNDDLGTFVDLDSLEDNPDITYFVLDWFKVINNPLLGVGTYQFEVEYTISGATGSFTSCVYDLAIYQDYRVDETVRIEALMNGYLEQFDIDYSGLNLKDCVRIPGKFGEQQPNYEKTTFKYKDRKKNTTRIIDTREFSLETQGLEVCITDHLQDWIFKADELYISDFNVYNHKNYKNFPVESPKEVELEYFDRSRTAILTAKFEDLFDNRRKLKCT